MTTEAECKNAKDWTTEGMDYNSIMLGANKILLVLEPLCNLFLLRRLKPDFDE